MIKNHEEEKNPMPVFSLTVSEFMGMLDARIAALLNESRTAPQMVQEPEARYEYSSKAAAARLGVSVVTFQNWKNHKLFSFTQINRKCVYDIPAIREELKKSTNGRRVSHE